MPKYEVTSPTGEKYEVNTPQAASQQDLINYVQQQFGGGVPSTYGGFGAFPAQERIAQTVDPQAAARRAPVSTGLKRSMMRIGSTFGDVIPAVGASLAGDIAPALGISAAPFDKYALEQLKEAEETEEKIGRTLAPAVPTYHDVLESETPWKAGGVYALETFGDQIPILASMVGTTLTGGLAAPALFGGLARKKLRKEILEKSKKKDFSIDSLIAAEKKVADVRKTWRGKGQFVGGMLGSWAYGAPEIFEGIYEKTGEMAPLAALGFGALGSALEMILPIAIARRLQSSPALKNEVIKKTLLKKGMDPSLVRGLSANIAKGGVKGLGVEVSTETGQEAIGILAERIVGDNWEALSSEEVDRLIESGVRGGIIGGPFGAVGGVQTGLYEQEGIKDAKRLEQDDTRLAELESSILSKTEELEQTRVAEVDNDVIAGLENELEELNLEKTYLTKVRGHKNRHTLDQERELQIGRREEEQQIKKASEATTIRGLLDILDIKDFKLFTGKNLSLEDPINDSTAPLIYKILMAQIKSPYSSIDPKKKDLLEAIFLEHPAFVAIADSLEIVPESEIESFVRPEDVGPPEPEVVGPPEPEVVPEVDAEAEVVDAEAEAGVVDAEAEAEAGVVDLSETPTPYYEDEANVAPFVDRILAAQDPENKSETYDDFIANLSIDDKQLLANFGNEINALLAEKGAAEVVPEFDALEDYQLTELEDRANQIPLGEDAVNFIEDTKSRYGEEAAERVRYVIEARESGEGVDETAARIIEIGDLIRAEGQRADPDPEVLNSLREELIELERSQSDIRYSRTGEPTPGQMGFDLDVRRSPDEIAADIKQQEAEAAAARIEAEEREAERVSTVVAANERARLNQLSRMAQGITPEQTNEILELLKKRGEPTFENTYEALAEVLGDDYALDVLAANIHAGLTKGDGSPGGRDFFNTIDTPRYAENNILFEEITDINRTLKGDEKTTARTRVENKITFGFLPKHFGPKGGGYRTEADLKKDIRGYVKSVVVAQSKAIDRRLKDKEAAIARLEKEPVRLPEGVPKNWEKIVKDDADIEAAIRGGIKVLEDEKAERVTAAKREYEAYKKEASELKQALEDQYNETWRNNVLESAKKQNELFEIFEFSGNEKGRAFFDELRNRVATSKRARERIDVLEKQLEGKKDELSIERTKEQPDVEIVGRLRSEYVALENEHNEQVYMLDTDAERDFNYLRNKVEELENTAEADWNTERVRPGRFDRDARNIANAELRTGRQRGARKLRERADPFQMDEANLRGYLDTDLYDADRQTAVKALVGVLENQHVAIVDQLSDASLDPRTRESLENQLENITQELKERNEYVDGNFSIEEFTDADVTAQQELDDALADIKDIAYGEESRLIAEGAARRQQLLLKMQNAYNAYRLKYLFAPNKVNKEGEEGARKRRDRALEIFRDYAEEHRSTVRKEIEEQEKKLNELRDRGEILRPLNGDERQGLASIYVNHVESIDKALADVGLSGPRLIQTKALLFSSVVEASNDRISSLNKEIEDSEAVLRSLQADTHLTTEERRARIEDTERHIATLKDKVVAAEARVTTEGVQGQLPLTPVLRTWEPSAEKEPISMETGIERISSYIESARTKAYLYGASIDTTLIDNLVGENSRKITEFNQELSLLESASTEVGARLVDFGPEERELRIEQLKNSVEKLEAANEVAQATKENVERKSYIYWDKAATDTQRRTFTDAAKAINETLIGLRDKVDHERLNFEVVERQIRAIVGDSETGLGGIAYDPTVGRVTPDKVGGVAGVAGRDTTVTQEVKEYVHETLLRLDDEKRRLQSKFTELNTQLLRDGLSPDARRKLQGDYALLVNLSSTERRKLQGEILETQNRIRDVERKIEEANLFIPPDKKYVSEERLETAATNPYDSLEGTGQEESVSAGPINDPTTVERTQDILLSRFEPEILDRVTIAPTPEAAGLDNVPSDVAAAVIKGRVYLFTNRINKGNEIGVLLHELGAHVGMRDFVGQGNYKILINKIKQFAKLKNESPEAQLARGALERVRLAVEAAGEEGLSESAIDDEILAYFVEEAVNRGINPTQERKQKTGLGAWFRRFMSGVKATLKKYGVRFKELPKAVFPDADLINAQEIVDLAYGAAKFAIRTPQSKITPLRNEVANSLATSALNLGDKVFGAADDTVRGFPEWSQTVAYAFPNKVSALSSGLHKWAYHSLGLRHIADVIRRFIPRLADAIDRLDSVVSLRRYAIDQTRRKFQDIAYEIKRSIEEANITTEQMEEFNTVAHTSTLEQIDLRDSQNPEVTKTELYGRFTRLPPALQKAYVDIVNTYEEVGNRLLDYYSGVLERPLNTQEKKQLGFIVDGRGRIVPYLPLVREGNYWVDVTINGTRQSMAFDTRAEAKREVRQMEKSVKDGGLGGKVHRGSYAGHRTDTSGVYERTAQTQVDTQDTGQLTEVLRRLDETMPENTDSEKEVKKRALEQVKLVHFQFLSSASLEQQYRERKGTAGYRNDVLQNFAYMGLKFANELALLETTNEFNAAMDNVNAIAAQYEGKVSANVNAALESIKKREKFLRNPIPKPWAAQLAYAGYGMLLLGNISSAAVNFTQLPIVTYGLLMGEYGHDKTSAALTNSFKMYFNGGKDDNTRLTVPVIGEKIPWTLADRTMFVGKNMEGGLGEIYRRLIDTAYARGAVRRTSSQELQDMRRGDVDSLTGNWVRTELLLGWLFQNSERANREISLMAAFNLALESGLSVNQSIEKAIRTVDRANGPGLAEAGPAWFTDGWGKVMGTFKRFAFSQIYLQSQLAADAFTSMGDYVDPTLPPGSPTAKQLARRQLFAISIPAWTFAGIKGIPLFGAASLFWNITTGIFGDDDEERKEFDMLVREASGDLAYRGPLSHFLNIDLASRTGFYALAFRDNPYRRAEIGTGLYALEVMAGPFYGVTVGNFTRAQKYWDQGENAKAIQTMMPAPIKNVWGAMNNSIHGAVTSKGHPLVENVSAYNTFMHVLGFKPNDLVEIYQENEFIKRSERKVLDRKRHLLTRNFAAHLAGDSEERIKITREIREYNKQKLVRNSGNTITAKTQERSLKAYYDKLRLSYQGLSLPRNARDAYLEHLGYDRE